MKLTGLGIFLILLGALALCPLLKKSTGIEGMTSTRASRGRPHRARRRKKRRYPSNQTDSDSESEDDGPYGPYGPRPPRPPPHYRGGGYGGDGGGGWSGNTPPGSFPGQGGQGPPQPAAGSPPPQAQVTGNGYQAPAGQGGASGASGALPAGIPQSQIVSGDEDLYILKSEVVPPVCPACPTRTECPRQEPCPPCPPCARCPEPAFECKKVPNYRTDNSQYLPRPVLTDFSQFGM